MRDLETDKAADPSRRNMLLTAGAAMIAGAATAGPVRAATTPGRGIDGMSAAERNAGPLPVRLQGVQHFGLTVQNMERAFEFYTEVLGGTEVFRHGDFRGDPVQNTLLADQRSAQTNCMSIRRRSACRTFATAISGSTYVSSSSIMSSSSCCSIATRRSRWAAPTASRRRYRT